MRITLTVDTDDERAVIRLLRSLLKRLTRDHGVKCTAVSLSKGNSDAP